MFGQPRTGIDVVAPVRLQFFPHCFRKREEGFQTPVLLDGCIISPIDHLHRGMLCCWYRYYGIVEGDLAAEVLLEFSQHGSWRDVRTHFYLVLVMYEQVGRL